MSHPSTSNKPNLFCWQCYYYSRIYKCTPGILKLPQDQEKQAKRVVLLGWLSHSWVLSDTFPWSVALLSIKVMCFCQIKLKVEKYSGFFNNALPIMERAITVRSTFSWLLHHVQRHKKVTYGVQHGGIIISSARTRCLNVRIISLRPNF